MTMVLLVLVLSAVLAAGPAAVPARLQVKSPPSSGEMSRQEAAEREKSLARITAEIERLRGLLAAEEKKEKTALSDLDRIGFTKRLLRNELRLLQMQLDKLNVERENVRQKIPALEAELDRRRDDLSRTLVTLYKYGRFGSVSLALESRDGASFLAAARALGRLAAAEDRRIAEYADLLAELGRSDEGLRLKENEIGALVGAANVKRRDLEAEEKKSQRLVETVKTNKKTYEQTLDELSVRARELQRLLQKLEVRDKPAAPLPFPAVPFASKKGQLPWPVAGRVVQGYGVQRGSFNTVTMNNGIEIAPPKDDLTIRALHAGKVVFSDFFPGYGNLIILEHGDGYYTLYGHCAEFLVPKEAAVKGGEPIAVAGDTGSLVGISLYLEIRYQTKPLNPLQWLERR